MQTASDKMSLRSAVSLAVGTMIGASIFSIFGLGARLAGQNLPWVFLVSGGLALLVAYSYAVLGRRIISDAGPVEFVLEAFGDGIVTGALSFLFWLTYVISIALFAKGFAGYLIPLVHLPSGGLMIHQWNTSRLGFFTVWGVLLGSLLVEWLYRSRTGRQFVERELQEVSAGIGRWEHELETLENRWRKGRGHNRREP